MSEMLTPIIVGRFETKPLSPPPPIVGNNKALQLAGRFPIDLTVSKLNKNTMKNNMFANP